MTGGVGGGLLTFIIPCTMYLKAHDKTDYLYNTSIWVCIISVILMVAVMTGVVFDQMDPVTEDDEE